MKNIPGPTVPLRFTLPKRKITARSYSWTIRTQNIKEMGNVMMIRNIDTAQEQALTHEVAQLFSSSSEIGFDLKYM